MSEALENLREHAQSLPSISDAKDAVISHLPSIKEIDSSAIRDKLPREGGHKRSWAVTLVGLATVAGAALTWLRRSRRASAPVSPSVYTPPLPKP